MIHNYINLTLFDGNESAPAEPSDTAPVHDSRKQRAFRALIAGEYKDEYAQATQRMIDKRFKQYKTMETEHQAIAPVVTALHGYYGTTDTDGLLAAMSAHHKQSHSQRQQTLDALRKLQAVREGFGTHLAAEAKLRDWQTQADKLQQVYGDFDLAKAAADPTFLAMLKAGVPMDKAWLSLRMPAAVGSRRSRPTVTSRPAENGIADRSVSLPGTNVSRLSRDQRAELARRSLKGETIRL